MIPYGGSERAYHPHSSTSGQISLANLSGPLQPPTVSSTTGWPLISSSGIATSASLGQLPANLISSGPLSSAVPIGSEGLGQGTLYPPLVVQDPTQRPYNRKSLPVSKWKLEKYAGSDQGLKLNEFLHLVSQLALSENVSEPELFDSAFHLFTGPALNWYMSMRSTGRLVNWGHLVFELRKSFVHPELDSLVRARIYQRRQARNETFQDFYYEMESMFRSMSNPMNEWERVDVLRRNMRSDYKKALLWKPIGNLSELLEAGHLIDASNFSLFSKMYGNEKSTNVVSFNNSNEGEKKQSFRPMNPKAQEKNYFKDKSNNSSKKEGNSKIEPKTSSSSNQPTKNENPGEGSSKPKRTLDYLVDGYKPPRDNECLFCRLTNHSLEQCRSQRGLMCLVCGFRGFETQNCPYCKKNGLQAVENRRPSNPHPSV